MSVINQMLKDLDNRQTQHAVTDTRRTDDSMTQATNKNRLVLLVLALILVVLVIIAWQLTAQRGKFPQSPANFENLAKEQKTTSKLGSRVNNKSSETVSNNVASLEEIKPSTSSAAETKSSAQNLPSPTENTLSTDVKSQEHDTPIAQQTHITPIVANTSKEHVLNEIKAQTQNSKNLAIDSKSNTQQAEPQLSISQKKLSPQELVAQKMRRVEVNINEGNTRQAERLLEEVLLIDANQIMARQQLAALWFGRQDYNAAHNLLAQGINLMPDFAEFRLMKARIYLKQNEINLAVDSLLPLSGVESTEYQSVLATAAQQINRHDVASDAFKKLTTLEPSKGRWWLGYGASLDSQGAFEQAKKAYGRALTTSSLSATAQQFIRQRLTVLGE